MVSVRIAETFDLCTGRQKIGFIGIHTPPRALIERHYGGLMNNHKFIKFTGCDVYFACASTLPVDPNGVGVGPAQVNPADLMNPVLFKAVSNDSFETVISRIYGGAEINSSSDGGSLTMVEGVTPASDPPVGMDDFNIYYGILSNPDGWRKAMPQVGFEMHGLKPLMYALLMNYGNNVIPTSNTKNNPVIWGDYPLPSGGGNESTQINNNMVTWMRGRGQVAPPVPLWSGINGTPLAPVATSFPKTYVGAIIVPPCHTGGSRIYYRLRVVWHIELIGLTSHQNFSSFLEMAQNGAVAYYNAYENGITSKMESDTDFVDANGFEIEKVMEGAS